MSESITSLSNARFSPTGPINRTLETGIRQIISPLSGAKATSVPCGLPSSRLPWVLITEEDGTCYVAQEGWMYAARIWPPHPLSRQQILISAAWARQHGRMLIVLRPGDVEAYERDQFTLTELETEPWYIPD